ncbi:predicted protein, partial [Nematostella vectensis]
MLEFVNTAYSPRDGSWGKWSQWTECSRFCNGGTRMRYRLCDSPSPRYGGKECHGERILEQECNTDPCPVSRDGGWGPWSAWTNCTRACDKGERQRHRHCDNPAPSYGGHSCRGEKQQRSACNTQPC